MHQPVIVERSHRMDSDRALETSSTRSVPRPRDQLSIDARRRAEGTVIELVGEIDLATRSTLASALCGSIRRGERVTIDLTDVTLLDAGGVALALELQRRVREHGGELVLANARGIVRRVLEILDPESSLTRAEAS
jgi:anti-anti-sigma factor